MKLKIIHSVNSYHKKTNKVHGKQLPTYKAGYSAAFLSIQNVAFPFKYSATTQEAVIANYLGVQAGHYVPSKMGKTLYYRISLDFITNK